MQMHFHMHLGFAQLKWKGIAVAILMCLDYIVPLVVESPANGARRVQYPGSGGGILAMGWKFFHEGEQL